VIDLTAQSCTGTVIATLKELLAAHKGSSPVQVRFHSSQGVRPFDVGTFRVEPGAGLLSELRVLLGTDAVRLAPLGSDDVLVIERNSGVPTPTG
jgi:hypothetical protein